MFGYVRPYSSELLVREYEQYKSVYCELCRELGKSFGMTARFTLSYDCTFYALLALCVSGARVSLHQGKCTVNPLKKCSFIASEGEEYKKAAALSVLMTYHKLRDNVEDEGFWKASFCKMLLPFVSRKARKAGERYPFLRQAVETAIEEQKQAEQDGGGVDRCADPTAKMLAAVFQELAGCDKGQSAALERFGYFLGRWVYLMDAADDLREDVRQKGFNPFIQRFSLESKTELTDAEEAEAHKACNEVLNGAAAQMLLPLNLIDMVNFGPIIENVIKKGLPEMQREILFLHSKRKRRRRGLTGGNPMGTALPEHRDEADESAKEGVSQ